METLAFSRRIAAPLFKDSGSFLLLKGLVKSFLVLLKIFHGGRTRFLINHYSIIGSQFKRLFGYRTGRPYGEQNLLDFTESPPRVDDF